LSHTPHHTKSPLGSRGRDTNRQTDRQTSEQGQNIYLRLCRR